MSDYFHSFIQQIFIEQRPCLRHRVRCRGANRIEIKAQLLFSVSLRGEKATRGKTHKCEMNMRGWSSDEPLIAC